MILKLCSRCGKPVVYPARYCDACAPIVQAEIDAHERDNRRRSNRRYNQKRDKRYERFYHSDEWKGLSARYIQKMKYKCEDCGALATETHHIIPIQTPEGWSRRFDWTNLRAQCIGCHNAKHDRF